MFPPWMQGLVGGSRHVDETFVSLMLEHATDGMCLVASDGTVLATTPAIERMLGMTPGALVGRNGVEFLHPDDVPAALDRLARLGEVVPDDYRIYRFLHAEGHYITVELVASENPEPLPGLAEGTLVLTVRDITEYHEARLALSRSQVRNELIARVAAVFVDRVDAEIDDAVTEALEMLATDAGADRAYVFRLSDDAQAMARSHSWTRPPHAFPRPAGTESPTDNHPGLREALLALEPLIVDDYRRRTTERPDPAEATRASPIGAILGMPLVREGRATGFLALDVIDRPHRWQDEDVELLRVATDIIGSALARRDASEASRAAEARFRVLVEHSSDALIVIDHDAVISHLPIGTHLFGYRPEDLVGVNALELVHPDDLAFAADEMIKAVADPGYQATNAMRIRHADGRWVPIELVASSHFDDPAINGVIMNVRDHTERDRFATALRASEERLRLVIGNLPGAVFRCDASPPYRDEYVSDMIETLTGYRAQDFVEGRVSFEELIPPDDRHRTDVEMEDALAAHGSYVVEYPIRHRDGTIRWLSEHGQVLRGAAGEPQHLEGFIFDVTSRVDAVNETRETEMKLASLVAKVPGAVFRCELTPPYRDLFMSAAIEDLTGYPHHRFSQDLELYDLIPDRHRAELDAEIARAVAAHRPYLVEYEIEHRDGRLRWIEERGQVHYGDDGEPLWIDGAMTDLTLRKELEERLAHDATHDPLTGLLNRTRLLEHLEQALARSERLGSLTAVLFVDLDRFKLVNDALGHTAGDELLVHFTRRLRSVLRESDLAALSGRRRVRHRLYRPRRPERGGGDREPRLAGAERPVHGLGAHRVRDGEHRDRLWRVGRERR